MGQRWVGAAFLLVPLVLGAPAAAQDGTVLRAMKISRTSGGMGPRPLDVNDQIGRGGALIGDLDGDGVPEIATAGHADDDGGLDVGCAYIVFMRRDGRAVRTQKISMLAGGFTGVLREGDQMGRAMAGLGDLDGDGVPDLAVGANFDDEGGTGKGAVWILFLNRDGTVKSHAKIAAAHGMGGLRVGDQFGRALAGLDDFDGDGIPDLAVASPYDDDGGENKGAVYVLTLRRDGTVKTQVKISQTRGGFRGRLKANDVMGFGLCSLGDFDGNGAVDLAAGAGLDDDGAVNAGAVWILFLKPDGTVLREQKISNLAGGFTGVLLSPYQFGDSVAAVGDLNGDGRTELAVGAVKDGDVGRERGAVYVLFLNADGTVASHQKISQLFGGFPYRLDSWDWLGSSLTRIGDLDLDGVPDLLIGARNDDDGAANAGAVYVTFMRGTSATSLVAASGASSGPGLRLASGLAAPGERVGLVLTATLPGGAEPRLLLGRRRRAPDASGIALDPRGLVHGLAVESEITAAGRGFGLELPDDPALVGVTLWAQAARFESGHVRALGAPLELVVQE